MNNQETVLFLHIPKTAGTTLHSIMGLNYPQDAMYSTDPASANPFGDFMALDARSRNKIKVIVGHFNFGFHTLILGKSVYITVLREPIERMLSEFYHIKRDPAHGLHGLVQSGQMDLIGYLDHLRSIYLDNRQTRMFAGAAEESERGEKSSAKMLAIAKNNLKNHISVVGMTEQFDETLLLVQKRLGWQHTFYTKRNVTSNRPKQQDLPPNEQQALLEHNQYDLALYRYGQALFTEQIEQHGTAFYEELAQMRQQHQEMAAPVLSFQQQLRQKSARQMLKRFWAMLQQR